MSKRKTTKQFVKEANEIFKGKYDFSKVEYVNNSTKVCVQCNVCGIEFWATPNNLLKGHGCPKCSGRLITTEEIVDKFKSVHKDRYDYSLVKYVKSNQKIAIICREHGVFYLTPSTHLYGHNCPICSKKTKSRKLSSNTQEFIEKAIKVHEEKFDYSKVKYIDARTKVEIVCKTCGKTFEQKPNAHLNGHGCPYCSHSCALTNNEFIEKAQWLFGDKYDYSNTDYKNSNTKVEITCNICGKTFFQTPSRHLMSHGCPYCNGGYRYTQEKFIEKANKKHNNRYDYSKVNYVNSKTKICIICHKKDADGNEHGEFWQKPIDHLNMRNCPKCGAEATCDKLRLTDEEFVERATAIHHGKYDYSRVHIKKNNRDVVEIICPNHGIFKQVVGVHLEGCGCQKCNQSKLETEIEAFLTKNGVDFETQKRFGWLGRQSLDFYLPQYNIGIECQGEQHYRPVSFGGVSLKQAQQNFAVSLVRDEKKRALCRENGVKLLYYSNAKQMVEDDISFHTKERLMGFIKNYKSERGN